MEREIQALQHPLVQKSLGRRDFLTLKFGEKAESTRTNDEEKYYEQTEYIESELKLNGCIIKFLGLHDDKKSQIELVGTLKEDELKEKIKEIVDWAEIVLLRYIPYETEYEPGGFNASQISSLKEREFDFYDNLYKTILSHYKYTGKMIGCINPEGNLYMILNSFLNYANDYNSFRLVYKTVRGKMNRNEFLKQCGIILPLVYISERDKSLIKSLLSYRSLSNPNYNLADKLLADATNYIDIRTAENLVEFTNKLKEENESTEAEITKIAYIGNFHRTNVVLSYIQGHDLEKKVKEGFYSLFDLLGKRNDFRIYNINDLATRENIFAENDNILPDFEKLFINLSNFSTDGEKVIIAYGKKIQLISLTQKDDEGKPKVLAEYAPECPEVTFSTLSIDVERVLLINNSTNRLQVISLTQKEDECKPEIIAEFDIPKWAEWGFNAKFSPDGCNLLIFSSGGEMQLISLVEKDDEGKPKVLAEYNFGESISKVHFSPDGSRLLMIINGVVKVISLTEKDDKGYPRVIAEHDLKSKFRKNVHVLAFSPDGQKVAIKSNNILNIISLTEKNVIGKPKVIAKYRNWGETIREADFSPDGKMLVISEGSKMKVISSEVTNHQGNSFVIAEYDTGTTIVYNVKFSPDGEKVMMIKHLPARMLIFDLFPNEQKAVY
ncbi:MAG: hypothetical protein KatS3mg089_0600 [Patescibacteria group bacterium]|nr:MAG: hypothetical protein KatS3mg089_0600 [Patescibacteria group bacterium]